jgi:hypothetical protein
MNRGGNAIILSLSLALSFLAAATAESPRASIHVNLRSGCMLGDFDAIRQDLGFSDNQRLLLSVLDLETGHETVKPIFEGVTFYGGRLNPLSTSETDAAAQRMQELYAKGDTAPLPLSDSEPHLYAILICKDSQASGTCLDKDAQDISKVLERYGPTQTVDSEAPDRLYFIQFLKAEKDAVLALNAPPTESEFRGFVGTSKLSPRGESVREKAVVLNSIPLTATTNGATLILPYFDRNKCGQLGAQPPIISVPPSGK